MSKVDLKLIAGQGNERTDGQSGEYMHNNIIVVLVAILIPN